jgi:hypothetical protein
MAPVARRSDCLGELLAPLIGLHCNTSSATVAATLCLQYLYSASKVVDIVKPNLSGSKFKICLFGFSSLSHICHL